MNINKNDLLDKLTSNVRPTPVGFMELSASFIPNEIMDTAANELKNQVILASDNLSADDLQVLESLPDYFNTLIALRCNYVNKSTFTPLDYRNKQRWVIPSIIAVLMQNIGFVEDHELGIIIKPSPIEGSKFLDFDVFLAIERILKALGNKGLVYSPELPRDPTGSWELMSLCVINDEILAINSSAHPTFALLASFVHFNALSTVITPRVRYVSLGKCKALVRDLISLRE